MRLTLRTMLAYLDDILEPQDARELEQKIGESKFASELVHRIRGSTRRLRLGAPKVNGRGMAADANTVAEYLDNVMPADKLVEFEKVCLESDVHLAEVASAHQILTLVLGEPAEFSPALRDRMYEVGQMEVVSAAETEAESESESGEAGRSAPPPQPVAADASTAVVAMPNVSSEPVVLARPARVSASGAGWPWRSLAVTLLLGFALAAAALRVMGEFGPNHPILRFVYGSRQAAEVAQSSAATTPAPDGSGGSQGAANLTGTNTDAASAQVAAAVGSSGVSTESPAGEPRPEAALATSGTVAAPPAAAPAAPAASAVSADAIPSPSSPGLEARPANANPARPAEASDSVGSIVPAASGSATVVPTPPGSAAAPAPAATAAVAVPRSSADRNAAESGSPPRVAAAAVPSPPAAPITIGGYLSEEQVIGRLDHVGSTWMVLPANASLSAGDELLSLPTFRPQVLVAPSVKLTLCGEVALKMRMPAAANVPSVAIRFGRVLMVPVGDMGGSIQIDAGGRTGTLSFAGVESAVALEVRWYLPPGQSPETSPAHRVVEFWTPTGEVVWQEEDRSPVRLAAGQAGWFFDEEEIHVAASSVLPAWIDGRNLTDIDRRASQELRKFLTSDRPLSLSLMEQTNYRQVEVRSLTCRALCYLDIFEPALESLKDELHRAYWHAQLDAIRARMAAGGEAVGKLRGAVEKLYVDHAADVWRLLIGYAPDQLASGGSAQLVEDLSSPSTTVRVLAYENLRRITGKTFLFRPEERPEQEKSKVSKWRKMQEDGQIVYITPPSPLPLLPAGSETPRTGAP